MTGPIVTWQMKNIYFNFTTKLRTKWFKGLEPLGLRLKSSLSPAKIVKWIESWSHEWLTRPTTSCRLQAVTYCVNSPLARIDAQVPAWLYFPNAWQSNLYQPANDRRARRNNKLHDFSHYSFGGYFYTVYIQGISKVLTRFCEAIYR
jgi:hypothetical protein